MGYFNISLDNDINYLLQEIGHNTKVNNVPAKTIVNNSGNIDYDDKDIITHEELRRGYYVEYNDLFFLVISDIVDKRYNTYYKGTMRRCNYDIKFIIDDRLYLYYSIIDGKNFTLEQGSYIIISADKITVTLPDTNITRQLQLQNRIIKFNTAWEIEGIDYTKKGLIILHCKRGQVNSVEDDLENEIANRYDHGEDRLKGNVNPILPFDEEPEPEPKVLNIIDVSTLSDIEVDQGTLIDDIVIPNTIAVTLEDNSTLTLTVNWDTSNYDGDIVGTYNLVGTLQLIEGVTNTNNLVASINIVVNELSQEDDYSIEIIGSDTIPLMGTETYIAKIYNNGALVNDKSVIWSADDRLNIKEVTDTTCTIEVLPDDYSTGFYILRVTLADDETVFAEKETIKPPNQFGQSHTNLVK